MDDHKVALQTPLIDNLGDKRRRGRCSGLEEGKTKPCRSEKSTVLCLVTVARHRHSLVTATDRKILLP